MVNADKRVWSLFVEPLEPIHTTLKSTLDKTVSFFRDQEFVLPQGFEALLFHRRSLYILVSQKKPVHVIALRDYIFHLAELAELYGLSSLSQSYPHNVEKIEHSFHADLDRDDLYVLCLVKMNVF